MRHQFDDLAKALAEDMSRREALRRLGGGLATALLASLGLGNAWGMPLNCTAYCRGKFDHRTQREQFRACTVSCRDCQHGGGSVCGVSAGGAVTCCSSPAPYCVEGACKECRGDSDCGSGRACQDGSCGGCSAGLTLCDGNCVDLSSDMDNCGACGAQCDRTAGFVTCQPNVFCSSGYACCNEVGGCSCIG